QTELLRFILSRRYSFTPLNIANAMAGLPYMQWRQSSKRCGRMQCPIVGGSSYQLFRMLDKVNRASSSAEGILNAVENRLQNSPKPDYIAADLRRNWYYLRAAINAVVEQRPHPHSIPFRILSEYQRRMQSRTSIDLVLEEEHALA